MTDKITYLGSDGKRIIIRAYNVVIGGVIIIIGEC